MVHKAFSDFIYFKVKKMGMGDVNSELCRKIPPGQCVCYDYTPLSSGYIFCTSGLRPSVKKYPSVIGVS